jgi:hypothetical protein
MVIFQPDAMIFYSPTSLTLLIDTFLSHWAVVESVNPAFGPLIVLGDVARSDLAAMRTALDEKAGTLGDAETDLTLARSQERALRKPLAEMMRVFNLKVRGDFPGTPWEDALAQVTGPAVAAGRLLDPLRRTLHIWRSIDAALPAPGFVLPMAKWDATSGDFAAGFDAWEAATNAVIDAEMDATLARLEQLARAKRAVAVMKAYGHGVKARLGDGPELVKSIPQLWPGPRRGARKKKRQQE